MKIPVVGPSYQMDDRAFDHQRSINCYPIISENPNSKDFLALVKCPGLSLYATAGSGPIRGGISTSRGRSFVVSGFDLYEITAGGSTFIGSLDTATSRVSIAENGDQVMIVDGTSGYIFTQSTDTFAEITDIDFPTASMVVYLDGYFIVNKVGTAAFYYSALNDGFDWDPTDFAVVSSNPDNLIGIVAERGDLWLFGNRSVEVYDNTGDAVAPFQRIGGAIFPTGCEAEFTIKRADNAIVWLGKDEDGRGVVWRSNGYNAEKISTQAIDTRIAESAFRDESFAWTYHQDGHAFYLLQVKGLDTTLVYDFTTKQWHERCFNNPTLNKRESHRASCHFTFDNKNLVGDRETGKIYELTKLAFDDDGDEMYFERIFSHLDFELQNIKHSKLELDCTVGQGIDGREPQIMLKYSDDGGYTWSEELWIGLGNIGEYRTRVEWRKLGKSIDRVYWIKVTDPVKLQINEGFLNGA